MIRKSDQESKNQFLCTRIGSHKQAAYSRLSSVRTTDEFRTVYKTGRFVSNGEIVLYTRANGLPHSRLGVSVSGKSGNSVNRHRFVRLMREIFRLHQLGLKSGTDYVIVLKKSHRLDRNALSDYRAVEHKILLLLSRAGVYDLKKLT